MSFQEQKKSNQSEINDLRSKIKELESRQIKKTFDDKLTVKIGEKGTISVNLAKNSGRKKFFKDSKTLSFISL